MHLPGVEAEKVHGTCTGVPKYFMSFEVSFMMHSHADFYKSEKQIMWFPKPLFLAEAIDSSTSCDVTETYEQ